MDEEVTSNERPHSKQSEDQEDKENHENQELATSDSHEKQSEDRKDKENHENHKNQENQELDTSDSHEKQSKDQEDKENHKNQETQELDTSDSHEKTSFEKDYLSENQSEKEENKEKNTTLKKNNKATPKRNKYSKKKGKSRKSKRKKMSTRWQNISLLDESSDDEEKEEREIKAKHTCKHSGDDEKDNIDKRNILRPLPLKRLSRGRLSIFDETTFVGDYSESSSESEEEDGRGRDSRVISDFPSEYWQIQKLVKFLKIGNQTATLIALCAISDFNLSQEVCQLAIRDVGGLPVLVNLLKTDCDKCKIGALKVLQPLSTSSKCNRKAIIDLGGLQLLVDLISSGRKDIRSLAASVIASIAKSSRARNLLRRCGGIRKLVKLLSYQDDENTIRRHKQSLSLVKQQCDMEVVRGAALALWSCSKSVHGRSSIFRAGSVPLLARLIKEDREELLIPVVGIIQECAVESRYRLAFQRQQILRTIVQHLTRKNEELQTLCASAIFRCGEDEDMRKDVNLFGGLEPLANLLSYSERIALLASATGAIWKCAICPINAKRFVELNVVVTLLGLLRSQYQEHDQIQIHAAGAVGELAKDPNGRKELLRLQGCDILVGLLTIPNDELRANVASALGSCAETHSCRKVINSLGGLQLLWTLMKRNNEKLVANAAWAVYRLMEDNPAACETARSLVGGFELIIELLKWDDDQILRGACAAISNIAANQENVAILTDFGVVPLLAGLTSKTDPELRQYVAEAISGCCSWATNTADFCRAGVVEHMVNYLKRSDPLLHRSAVRALHGLSQDPEGCIRMHEQGIVKLLVRMVGSDDEILQEEAAACLRQIRDLAMANEKTRKEIERRQAEEKKAKREKKFRKVSETHGKSEELLVIVGRFPIE